LLVSNSWIDSLKTLLGDTLYSSALPSLCGTNPLSCSSGISHHD
jgi:hypothetical protein